MSSLVKFPHHIHFEIYLLILSFVIMISGHYNNKAGELVVYSDSDWAGDKTDKKSMSGFVAILNGDLVV